MPILPYEDGTLAVTAGDSTCGTGRARREVYCWPTKALAHRAHATTFVLEADSPVRSPKNQGGRASKVSTRESRARYSRIPQALFSESTFAQ